MKIVVGLGNPGKRYENTPHNAGFLVIDALARELSCRLRRSWRTKALLGKAFPGGEAVWLVKPQTFMNNSGGAVAAILRYHRAGPGDLVVVVDDADLPLGRLRVRAGGSSGGHRGLESIIEQVGSRDFARVRIGIGRERGADSLVDHVLSPFSAVERPLVDRVTAEAARAVLMALGEGVEAAMNVFNGMTIQAE